MGISPDFGFFRLGTEQAGDLHTWRAGVVMQAERVRVGIAAARDVSDDAREASLAGTPTRTSCSSPSAETIDAPNLQQIALT